MGGNKHSDEVYKRDTLRPVYPKRVPMYAIRLLKLLIRSNAASEITPDGFTLVMAIAGQEDANFYRGGVVILQPHLLQMTGFRKWDRLDRARKIAVEKGWLVYFPPERGAHGPGTYWTTMPMEMTLEHDGPIDEGGSPEEVGYRRGYAAGLVDAAARLHGQPRPEPAQESISVLGDGKLMGTGHLPDGKLMGTGTYIPNPKPIPAPKEFPPKSPKGESEEKPSRKKVDPLDELAIPSALDTSRFRESWEMWKQHRREIRKPLKATSAKALLAKLAMWGEDKACAAIAYTVEKGWQGLVDPDELKGKIGGSYGTAGGRARGTSEVGAGQRYDRTGAATRRVDRF